MRHIMGWEVALAMMVLALPQARAAPGDCGAVTPQGSCSGDTLTWCEAAGTATERVEQLDCTTGVLPSGVAGVCAFIQASYGSDCASDVGQACRFVDAQGRPVITWCAGRQPACVFDDVNATSACRASVGACTPAPAGQDFAPTCVGSVLALGCQQGQPFGPDCAAVGGTCNAGQCLGVAQGTRCDARFTCAAGLECDGVTGRCVDPANRCDPTVFVPTCNQDALTVCDTASRLRAPVDCTQEIPDGGALTCGPQFTCLDDAGACAQLGAGCVGNGVGAPCDVARGVLCVAGLGCVMGLGPDGTAVERCAATGSCGRHDEDVGCLGEVATFCLGNDAVTAVEAAGFDCAALASHCVVDAVLGPVCVGAAGARCDDPVLFPGSPFQCAAGFTCARSTNRFGTCVAPVLDGGVVDGAVPPVDGGGDAGVTPPPPPDDPQPTRCGCQGTLEAGAAAWLPAALVLVWRVARRRGKQHGPAGERPTGPR